MTQYHFPVTCETIIDVLPFPEPFPDTEPIPFVLFGFLLIEFMYLSSNVPKDDNDSTPFFSYIFIISCTITGTKSLKAAITDIRCKYILIF